MNIRKLLYEGFDRTLTVEEERILNEALSGSETLRKEKEYIRNLRESISTNTQKDFEPGFEERVLQKINAQRKNKGSDLTFFNSLNILFKRIAFATIIIVIISLSYNFTKSGNVSLQSALGIKQQKTSLAESFYNNIYYFFNME